HRTEVVEGALFAAHDPVTAGEIGVSSIAGFRLECRLIETRRQHIDQVDVAGKLGVLLPGNAAGHKNAEMANGLVDRVDDRLAVIPDLVDIAVEIENPAQRLLRRGNVVALGAEHHDRGADLAEVDDLAVRSLDPAGREIIANEQFIDDELDLLGVQVDMPAPPSLEFEIAIGFRVDL